MSFINAVLPMLLCIVALSTYAGPVIEFDVKEFDCGTILEGEKDKVEAIFTIKNTGDEPLKLSGVRPSCGCTVVKFDSLVQPGGSTKITSTFNIRGRKGKQTKYVTVTSNSETDQTVRLTLKANILEPLASSVTFIDMTGDAGKTTVTMALTSTKKELKISELVFVPSSTNDANKSPAKELVKLTFALVPTDSLGTEGLYTYRLELTPVALDASTDGEFILKTNHPNKKEFRIRGKVGSNTSK